MSFPVKELKAGNASVANTMANTKAIAVSKKASNKNCITRSFLCEPIAFLTPTSFAHFSERAVVRLIKLIHAINNTSKPIMVNMRTYSRKPSVSCPFT